MFKLIAIDMDGTLLNDDHEVTEQVKNTLAEAKNHGVKIVLCSGRPIVGMRSYIEELNLDGAEDYAIAFNGAITQNTNTREIVSDFTLNYENLLEIQDLSKKLNSPMQYFDIEKLYTPDRDISKYTILEAYLNNMALTYCPVEEFPKDISIPNIMYIDEAPKLTETINNIPKDFYDKYAIVQSAPHFMEFTHLKATKGNAVKNLAERIGIKQEEVMAIGDNGNDVSMIQYAGCGVAMKNAIPELKREADYETLSNNEGGVAHVIQKLVLDKLNV